MLLLMVLVSTPGNTEVHLLQGKRSATQQDYLESHAAHGERVSVFCVEFEARGYEEAVHAFRKTFSDSS